MATQPRRYAAGTTVDVAASQLEIKRLVARHGATAFMIAEGDRDGKLTGILQFTLRDRMVRYERVYPSVKECCSKKRVMKLDQVDKKREAEWRRRWRALFMIIKAKLEMVAAGDTEFENEFLADILLPEGGTVANWLVPQLMKAYDNGQMPSLLPSGD